MSSVAYLDLFAHQNENFDADVALNKIISKLSFDAKHFELKGQIRKHHLSKDASETFTINPSNSVGSCFNMSLTSEQTKNLKAGRYIYDVFVIDRTNNIAKYSYKFGGSAEDYIYVNSANVNIKEFKMRTNRFTLDFWIYPTEIITNCSFLNVSGGIYFGIEGGDIVIKNATTTIISYPFSPIINTWTQIKIARSHDGTDLTPPTNCKYVITVNGQAAYEQLFSAPLVDFSSDEMISVRLGETFPGYISNLRLTNGTYFTDYPKTEILTPTGESILLTCRDESFVDNSNYKFTIMPNGSVLPDKKSPFISDIVTYKLLEGCLFINASATRFTV